MASLNSYEMLPSEPYNKLSIQQGTSYKTSQIFRYLSLILALVLLLQSTCFAWMWLSHRGNTCSDSISSVAKKESKLNSSFNSLVVKEMT